MKKNSKLYNSAFDVFLNSDLVKNMPVINEREFWEALVQQADQFSEDELEITLRWVDEKEQQELQENSQYYFVPEITFRITTPKKRKGFLEKIFNWFGYQKKPRCLHTKNF